MVIKVKIFLYGLIAATSLLFTFNNCGEMGNLDVALPSVESGVPLRIPPPDAPQSLVANSVSAAQINLSWQDNSNNESGFKIERSTALAGPFNVVATLSADVITYSDTSLTAVTTYYYRVFSFNTEGPSPTIFANATTLALPPPVAPSNLLATGFSQSQINLSWSDNSSDESGFRIERSSNMNGPWTDLITLNAGTTSHSDTSISGYVRYYYRVYALRGNVNSSYSAVVTASTLPPPNAAAWVTSVTAIQTGARITMTGPVQMIRYFHDFSNGSVNVAGTPPFPSTLDVAITFPLGTTFICFQVAGTDGVFNGAFVGDPQQCNMVP